MMNCLKRVTASAVLLCAVHAAGQAPPEFTQVDADASQIDLANVLLAINCGTGTYDVNGVRFWAWGATELQASCGFSATYLTGPDWNAAWPNPFADPALVPLAEVYKAISYHNLPLWVELRDLNPEGFYTIQFLFTANAVNNWDHGGSVMVTGADEQWVARDFHLNTFAMGIPFVVRAEDVQPRADGVIRIDYVREADWVPSPALDVNKIWQGIILTGPPITFPTDCVATKEGDVIRLAWKNHEPSTNGTPYDEIDIYVDGQLRAVLGEGAAVIDEAADDRIEFDLSDPANAPLREGAHHYVVRTNLGGFESSVGAAYGIAPVRIAVGPYGDPYAQIETSDGRAWTPDTLLVKGDRLAADWQGAVDPLLGIPGLDAFGLDPLNPSDQILFSHFLYDGGGTPGNHLAVQVPIPNGAYDVYLYFWEYGSPWVFDRTAIATVERGAPTFVAYGDVEGVFAAAPNEGWRLAIEAVSVGDGVLDIDLLPGWSINADVTLAAVEVLPASPAPRGPRNFTATTTGNMIYRLAWETPAGAAYDRVNILSRMSGQKDQVPDPAAASYTFEQEIDYESTTNEAFVLQAREGNTFYAQLHAGAGVAPMYINAGGAGDVNGCPGCVPPVPPANAVAAIQARDLTWVSDLGYANRSFDFVAPLLNGDRNHAFWGTQPFTVVPDSPAAMLEPPFATPESLAGDELALFQNIRWTWSTPSRDPILMPMRWEIPINPGTYLVRLYFGEGCCPPSIVYRACDITAEGSEPIRIYYHGLAPDDAPPDDREYVLGAMGEAAIAQFDDVTVGDGFLSLVFASFCGFKEPYDNNPTVAAIEVLAPPAPPQELFVRGDINNDDKLNIADAISLLSHLFAALPKPLCPDAADANDDGKLDIADAIRVLGHLFAQTGPLPPPFGECGPDPTDTDTLTPCDYPPCKAP